MNLKEIMTGSPEKFLDFVKNNTQLGERRQKLAEYKYRLKKLKTAEDTKYALLLPIELSVPFNPFDFKDESVFNAKHPFNFPGSVTTMLIKLKELLKADAEFAQFVAEDLGVEVADLRLDDPQALYKEDTKVFAKYRRLLVYTDDVQCLHTDPASQYGIRRHVDVHYDENGDIQSVWTDPVTKERKEASMGIQLYMLENALIALRIEEINKEFTEGDMKNRPEAEKKAAIKAVYAERLITNPYVAGFTRAEVFTLTNDKLVDKESAADWNRKKDLQALEHYVKVTTADLGKYQGFIGGRFDFNLDYLEINWSVPKKTSDQNVALQIDRDCASSDTRIMNAENGLKGFDEKYREYRDNLDMWDPAVMRRSVYDFFHITDDEITNQFRNNLKRYEDVMANQVIAENYMDVMDKIDESLSSRVIEQITSNSGSTVELKQENLASIPKVTQETEDDDIGATAFEEIAAGFAEGAAAAEEEAKKPTTASAEFAAANAEVGDILNDALN